MRRHRTKTQRHRHKSAVLMRAMLDRAAPLPASHATTVGIACYLALDALHAGHGTDSNMNQLAYAINLALALAELGVVASEQETIIAAQDALVCANAVSLNEGRWIISGDCYRSICDALAIHDRQIQIAAGMQIQAAHGLIHERLAAGDVIHVDIRTS